MGFEEHGVTGHDPETFPDPVTQNEAAVENRDSSLGTSLEFAIYPDPDCGIARVIMEVVNAGAHTDVDVGQNT